MNLTSFSRSYQHSECQILTKNNLSAPYLLNQIMDSGQTCIVSLGQLKHLFRFWWPWPNFQGNHTIKTVKWALSALYLPGFALPVAIVAKCEEKIFLAQKNFIWRNKWRKKFSSQKIGTMSLNRQLTSWITCLKSVADQLIHDDNNSPHCFQSVSNCFFFLFFFFWHNQLQLTLVNLWSITAYIENSHFFRGSVG